MPKDPKRNIQSYQIQGGHLNEFEFQKRQGELAGESELPFADENVLDSAQATKRLAEVTAEAHRIVEKRKKRNTKTGTRQRVVAGKRPSTKLARKSATKAASKARTKKTTQAGTKKRGAVKSKRKG